MFGQCCLNDWGMISLDTEWTFHSWEKPQRSPFANTIDFADELWSHLSAGIKMALYFWECSFVSTAFNIELVARVAKQCIY